MPEAETRTGGGLPVLKVMAITLSLILAAAAGGLGGVWYSAQRNPDLANRLASIPVVGGLFELSPPPEEEQTSDPEDLKEALLELRERDLEAAKAELERERSELAVVSDQVARDKEELDARSLELDLRELELEGRTQEIDRLAAVYGQMKPAAVARILGELDDGLAVAILDRLDERQAARILEELEPGQVARYALRSEGRTAEGR